MPMKSFKMFQSPDSGIPFLETYPKEMERWWKAYLQDHSLKHYLEL